MSSDSPTNRDPRRETSPERQTEDGSLGVTTETKVLEEVGRIKTVQTELERDQTRLGRIYQVENSGYILIDNQTKFGITGTSVGKRHNHSDRTVWGISLTSYSDRVREPFPLL